MGLFIIVSSAVSLDDDFVQEVPTSAHKKSKPPSSCDEASVLPSNQESQVEHEATTESHPLSEEHSQRPNWNTVSIATGEISVSTTKKQKGRTNNDKSASVETIFTAFAPDPEDGDNEDSRKPSLNTLASLLGLPKTTVHRKLKIATAKREGLLAEGEHKRVWSQLANPGKGHTKNTPAIITTAVCEWIRNHPNVIVSPIAKDAIFVERGGRRQRVHKLMREISIRELHKLMTLRESEAGGLHCTLDANGNILVSDTSLRRIIINIYPNFLWGALCHYRRRMVAALKKVAENVTSTAEEKEEARRYKEDHVDKAPEKAASELDSIMCPGIESCGGRRKLRCVLRRCDACPTYKIDPAENRRDAEAPPIRFRVKRSYK